MMHLLQSDHYNIQLATVSCLTHIFNKKWLHYDENAANCAKIQRFHMDLEERLKINELKINEENDIDRNTCISSIRLQFYCSIIGVCYALRKNTLFKLIEFCRQELDLSQGNLWLKQREKNAIHFEYVIFDLQTEHIKLLKNCAPKCFKAQYQRY